MSSFGYPTNPSNPNPTTRADEINKQLQIQYAFKTLKTPILRMEDVTSVGTPPVPPPTPAQLNPPSTVIAELVKKLDAQNGAGYNLLIVLAILIPFIPPF